MPSRLVRLCVRRQATQFRPTRAMLRPLVVFAGLGRSRRLCSANLSLLRPVAAVNAAALWASSTGVSRIDADQRQCRAALPGSLRNSEVGRRPNLCGALLRWLFSNRCPVANVRQLLHPDAASGALSLALTIALLMRWFTLVANPRHLEPGGAAATAWPTSFLSPLLRA